VIARLLGGQEAGQITARQGRKRAARSRRDMPRVEGNHDWIAFEIAEIRETTTERQEPVT
jgi:hypothetical protein